MKLGTSKELLSYEWYFRRRIAIALKHSETIALNGSINHESQTLKIIQCFFMNNITTLLISSVQFLINKKNIYETTFCFLKVRNQWRNRRKKITLYKKKITRKTFLLFLTPDKP